MSIRLFMNLNKTILSKSFGTNKCYFHTPKKMPEKRILLLSSSNVHGHDYMQYAANDIVHFLAKSHIKSVLFIPYAQFNYGDYHRKVGPVFRKLGFHIDSLHRCNDPKHAINNAEAIFVGGGNTFLLLKTLYDYDLIEAIKYRVLNEGIPYIGSSAGTNIATINIATTNDMPIVHPPFFEALNLVPFNINPHYYIETKEEIANKTHKGETRDERIFQYLELPDAPPVLGMKEGCILHIEGDIALVEGINNAVYFEAGMKPRELKLGTNISELLIPKNKLRIKQDA